MKLLWILLLIVAVLNIQVLTKSVEVELKPKAANDETTASQALNDGIETSQPQIDQSGGSMAMGQLGQLTALPKMFLDIPSSFGWPFMENVK